MVRSSDNQTLPSSERMLVKVVKTRTGQASIGRLQAFARAAQGVIH
jgi:hypothetical protein